MLPTKPISPSQAKRTLAERIEAARLAVAKGATHADTLALARRRKPGDDDPAWQEFQSRPKAPAPAEQVQTIQPPKKVVRKH